jgi:hypothetical protein
MPKKRKPIIVTVADDKLHEIHNVADKLRAKGMKVDRVMPFTGVIAGSSPTASLSALRKVQGVLSVEEEAVATLPPPNARCSSPYRSEITMPFIVRKNGAYDAAIESLARGTREEGLDAILELVPRNCSWKTIRRSR